MLSVHIDDFGETVVIHCVGRIVRSEAAFKLREAVTSQAVTSQRDARTIVLDLAEVPAIEGGGLGMLVFLQRWAHDHDIRIKLFNPCQTVRDRLEHVNSTREFDMATPDEMTVLYAPQPLAAPIVGMGLVPGHSDRL